MSRVIDKHARVRGGAREWSNVAVNIDYLTGAWSPYSLLKWLGLPESD